MSKKYPQITINIDYEFKENLRDFANKRGYKISEYAKIALLEKYNRERGLK